MTFVVPSIKNNNNNNYTFQLHWYKDVYTNVIYWNIFFNLKAYFILILKEIKTISWAPRSIVGPRHCIYCA